MKEFERWYDNMTIEYPLYQDKDGYNIGNIRALKAGWRAALEWVLSTVYADYDFGCDMIDQFKVEQELKEK